LVLSGMTLNSTVMPPLGTVTLAVDFNALDLRAAYRHGPVGFRPYIDHLEAVLRPEPAWRVSRRLLVGHSFGGMLALSWLLSAREPELARVDGLLLIGTTAGPMFDAARLRIGRAGGQGRRLPIKHLVPLWNLSWVTRAMQTILTRGRIEVGQVDFRTLPNPTDVALDLAGWRNTDWRAMQSYRLAMNAFDVRERLGTLQAPVIVLHGTEDLLFPVSVAEDLARRLPRGELRVVEGAGHGLPLTHGAAVVQAVQDLMAMPRTS
jgi:pimeloyl-ACP methyl ester carboxylesterase